MMNKNTTINERVLQIIDSQCNGNKKKFAEIVGFKPQVISNIVSGRKSKPSFDVLNAIKSSFVDIDSDWLLMGSGKMLKSGGNLKVMSCGRKTKDSMREIQEIPLYDLEATAGLIELMKGGEAAHLLDTIKIPNIPTCDGAISVTGDSMYPLLKSGDIILYKEVPVSEQNIYYGEIYLLGVRIDDYEEMVTVKSVQKSDRGNDYIKLVSQNQHHQPKDIPLRNITAMAMVKVSIRKNTMY